jgi:hypothetical protein
VWGLLCGWAWNGGGSSDKGYWVFAGVAYLVEMTPSLRAGLCGVVVLTTTSLIDPSTPLALGSG